MPSHTLQAPGQKMIAPLHYQSEDENLFGEVRIDIVCTILFRFVPRRRHKLHKAWDKTTLKNRLQYL
jgi:hypothetical protein